MIDLTLRCALEDFGFKELEFTAAPKDRTNFIDYRLDKLNICINQAVIKGYEYLICKNYPNENHVWRSTFQEISTYLDLWT